MGHPNMPRHKQDNGKENGNYYSGFSGLGMFRVWGPISPLNLMHH